MIIHLSFPAQNPAKVACVLSKLVSGRYQELSWCPGGYMVFSDDQFSTGIEVLPLTTVFKPGQGVNETLVISQDPSKNSVSYGCLHFLLTVELTEQEVFAIAKEAGWKAVAKHSLKVIEMIEFWIENTLMIEVVLNKNKVLVVNALNSKHYQGCIDSGNQSKRNI